MASLRQELRRLGTSSAVYLIPNLLLRGLTFLLTPIYARALTPADFGTLGVATTIGSIASVVLCLSLHGSVTRMHFECASVEEERTFYGTLLGFMLVFPTIVSLGLHVLGSSGTLDVFQTVRFRPHLQLVLWTAFAQSFLPLPTAMYTVREQPGRVALLNLVAALSQAGLTLLYVVHFHEGLLGSLKGALHSAVLTGAFAVVLMSRNAALRFSPTILKKALAFSVPLVPHALAAWGLSISDRLVLEHYVSRDDLGRYSIGYLFSFAVGLFAQSITTPLGPAANRQLKDPALSKNVPPLGTYTFLGIAMCAAGGVVFSRELIGLVAPPSYRGAEVVVPWVVLGAVFQGVYLISSTGTWFSMRTRLIPVVTAIGAVSNVALNLLLVPRWGILAAAVVTAASYGVMALLHTLLAHKLYPIRWEYERWAGVATIGVAAAVLSYGVDGPRGSTALKIAIFMTAVALATLAAGVRRLRQA